MTRTLDDIIRLVELTHERGTPEFDVELRRVKVLKCQDMRNVSSCKSCSKFHDCDLRVAHWRDMQLGEK